jgi:hypothetical protein
LWRRKRARADTHHGDERVNQIDKALCWLIAQGEHASWTLDELIDLTAGAVPIREAMRVCATLAAHQVLAEDADGIWSPGPRAEEWRAIEQALNGKRAGNDPAYLRARKARQAVQQRVWQRANPQVMAALAGSRSASR